MILVAAVQMITKISLIVLKTLTLAIILTKVFFYNIGLTKLIKETKLDDFELRN